MRSTSRRRADEPHRTRGEAALRERGPKDLVDEHRDGAECRAACPQYGRVQALEQLPGHVERDVRARLEVRADGPDRDPALADAKAVRKRPGVGLALERRDVRKHLELARERLHPRVVEAKSVERPRVETSARLLDVHRIRLEDRCPAVAHERSGAAQGI